MPFFKNKIFRNLESYAAITNGEEEIDKEYLQNTVSFERSVQIQLRRQRLLLYALVALLSMVCGLQVSTAIGTRTRAHPSIKPKHNESIPAPWGELSIETVRFEQTHIYMQPPSNESNAAWDRLLPPGRGFVFVPNAKELNLGRGETTQWGEIYSVSLFHQLHCLGLLRKHFWQLLNGIIDHDEDLEALAKVFADDHHTGHCFDYLRQGIQCAGDLSLEFTPEPINGVRQGVDGWGVQHQCKSWGAISEYMDKNHYNHSSRYEIAVD